MRFRASERPSHVCLPPPCERSMANGPLFGGCPVTISGKRRRRGGLPHCTGIALRGPVRRAEPHVRHDRLLMANPWALRCTGEPVRPPPPETAGIHAGGGRPLPSSRRVPFLSLGKARAVHLARPGNGNPWPAGGRSRVLRADRSVAVLGHHPHPGHIAIAMRCAFRTSPVVTLSAESLRAP